MHEFVSLHGQHQSRWYLPKEPVLRKHIGSGRGVLRKACWRKAFQKREKEVVNEDSLRKENKKNQILLVEKKIESS